MLVPCHGRIAALLAALVLLVAFTAGCAADAPTGPPAQDGSQICGPSTCPGCCNYAQCITQTTTQACGTAGFPCVVCQGSEVCQSGQCMPPAGGCGPINCPGGCCNNNLCLAGSSATACGSAGALCMDCTQSGGTCPNKTCQGGTGCSSASCSGCCDSKQCFKGNTHDLCGKGGVACVDCAAQGKSCNGASGTCDSAPPSCGPGSCSGCCANNTCVAGKSDSTCGMGGVSCVDCSTFGATCDGAAGTCKGGTPTCGPSGCGGGCCDNNQCLPGNTSSACGGGGSGCVDCAATGQTCDATSRTCQGTPPACSPGSCSGCCDAAGQCKPGTGDGACGKGGGSCVDCAAGGKTCDLASGSCQGATSCGPASCKWGCCDGSGQCQGGVKDSECGINGASCVDCQAKGESCDLISGLCKPAAPACGPGSCSGCCTPAGTCMSGTSSLNCGSGGAQCAACQSFQSCSAGGCAISSTSSWELKVVGATINQLKSWDSFGGAPDPYFGVDWDSCSKWSIDSPCSSSASDTYYPTWNHSLGTFSASKIKGGWCAFVGDLDTGFACAGTFNTIALCTVNVTDADLAAGSKTLSACPNPDDSVNYVTWLKFTFTYKP